MKEAEMEKIASLIKRVVNRPQDEASIQEVEKKSYNLRSFPDSLENKKQGHLSPRAPLQEIRNKKSSLNFKSSR